MSPKILSIFDNLIIGYELTDEQLRELSCLIDKKCGKEVKVKKTKQPDNVDQWTVGLRDRMLVSLQKKRHNKKT
jgi:hypothetical protein